MESKRVVKNASWIIGCKIVQALLAMIITVISARYLGPSDYGLVNYAASIVTFAAPIMYLGFNGTLVSELVNDPDNEGKIIGTAITMSFCSSFVCIAGVVAFTLLANAGETETLIVCALYSVLLIFQSLDLVQFWFQAKLLSKYASVVSVIAYVLVSGYKILLLVLNKGVYWFAIANAVDYMLIALMLLIIYKKKGGQKLGFSWKLGKTMFGRSKYFILSNLMIAVFGQTDRVMLKLMIDDAATGYYTAATTCAGMTSFVFSAIIDSMRPMIFAYKKERSDAYERSVVCLYSIIVYLALLQSVIMTVAAPLIINVLYGEDYSASIDTLRIIVWYCTFSYLGGARGVWILAEGKQKHIIVVNLVGALLNVGLNFALIPLLGLNGAAIATVITQVFANVIFVSIYKPTRRTGYLMLQSLNPKYLCLAFKNVFGKKPKLEQGVSNDHKTSDDEQKENEDDGQTEN